MSETGSAHSGGSSAVRRSVLDPFSPAQLSTALKTGVPTIGPSEPFDLTFVSKAFEKHRSESGVNPSEKPNIDILIPIAVESAMAALRDVVDTLITETRRDKETTAARITALERDNVELKGGIKAVREENTSLKAMMEEIKRECRASRADLDMRLGDVEEKAKETGDQPLPEEAETAVRNLTGLEAKAALILSKLETDNKEIRGILDDLTTRADTLFERVAVPAIPYAAPPVDPSGENDWTDAFASVSQATPSVQAQSEQSLITEGTYAGGYVFE